MLNTCSLTVAASGSVEISAVKVPAAEAAVCNEPRSNSTDDDNVWAKPLPVTKEKLR